MTWEKSVQFRGPSPRLSKRADHPGSGGFASLGKLAPPHRPCALLWLEIQHRFALLQIDRHRVLMVHDQPLAVDLTEASGPTQPEIGLLPIVHGSAYPVEAVGECNVIAHSDGQVVNFIAYRTLERREYLFPGFPECICSHVSQRGHNVERHDLLRVDRHDAFDVLVTNRLDPTLYYPFDFGFIVFLVFFDCHSFLLTLACYESHILVVICTGWFIAFRPRCSSSLAGRAPQAPVGCPADRSGQPLVSNLANAPPSRWRRAWRS